MRKYIVKDANDDLHVVSAKGYLPSGIVADAPEGAESFDGPNIDLVDGVATLNMTRKQAMLDLNQSTKDDQDAAKTARVIAIQKIAQATTVVQLKVALLALLNHLGLE